MGKMPEAQNFLIPPRRSKLFANKLLSQVYRRSKLVPTFKESMRDFVSSSNPTVLPFQHMSELMATAETLSVFRLPS